MAESVLDIKKESGMYTWIVYLWNPLTQRPFKLEIRDKDTEDDAIKTAYELYPRHEFRSIRLLEKTI